MAAFALRGASSSQPQEPNTWATCAEGRGMGLKALPFVSSSHADRVYQRRQLGKGSVVHCQGCSCLARRVRGMRRGWCEEVWRLMRGSNMRGCGGGGMEHNFSRIKRKINHKLALEI
jgi:hypothetical protein